MLKRIEAVYSGRVQGVGFRFTAERLAEDLGLRGWVKNLASGKVELVAEGKDEHLKNLLDGLKKHFGSYITDVQVSWGEPRGEPSKFRIAF